MEAGGGWGAAGGSGTQYLSDFTIQKGGNPGAAGGLGMQAVATTGSMGLIGLGNRSGGGKNLMPPGGLNVPGGLALPGSSGQLSGQLGIGGGGLGMGAGAGRGAKGLGQLFNIGSLNFNE